jgi:hypothetical protein
VVQTLIAAAAAVPVILPAVGVSTTMGFGALVVAVAAGVTRLMQVPQVAELLNKYFKVPMP